MDKIRSEIQLRVGNIRLGRNDMGHLLLRRSSVLQYLENYEASLKYRLSKMSNKTILGSLTRLYLLSETKKL